MALSSGTSLGAFEISGLLGAGGMGEVYRARDTRLGREVAVKVLPEALANDKDRLARFEREAKLLAALNHPHIAAIYELGRQGQTHFLVMELVEGTALDARLKRGAMPPEEALPLFAQIAEALETAHEQGIVHRDLKPANIKVTPDGRAKVLDFGLAKSLEAPISASPGAGGTVGLGSDPAGVTGEGRVLGTPAYMSPEQARGGAVDKRTDIWAFGCCLYEALAGRRPFGGGSSTEVLAEILKSDPDWGALPPATPERVRALLRRCLEKDVRRRLRDIGEARFEISEITSGSSPRVVQSAASGESSAARDRGSDVSQAPDSAIRKIAVLPLANISGDPGQEYFADGMTEALITELAKIKALRVISRNSVMQYRNTSKPMAVVAQELGVDALVAGSVLRAEDEVRITAQLIRAATDEHMWADSYDGTMSKILKLQKDVALAIVKEINVAVTAEERSRIAKAKQVNPEAYDLFLKAWRSFRNLTAKNLEGAVDLLRRAIKLEPDFADAHATLAYAYWQSGILGYGQASENYRKQRAAARVAVRIDENHAGGNSALGWAALSSEWDWAEAEHRFQRSLDADPNEVTAYMGLAFLNVVLGRKEKAYEYNERHLQLAPRAHGAYHMMAVTRFHAGDLAKSLEFGQKAIEGREAVIYLLDGVCCAALNGRFDLAEAWAAKAVEIAGRTGHALSMWSAALALAGKRDAAESLLAEMRELAKTESVLHSDFAWPLTALGRREEAIDALERAYTTNEHYMVWLGSSPTWDPLRGHPRFEAIVRKMDFPPRLEPK